MMNRTITADRTIPSPFSPVLGVAVTAALAVACWVAVINVVQMVLS